MARKKKTKRKKSGGLRGFFSKKKKGRRRSSSSSSSAGIKVALSVIVLALLAGGGAVGLIFLERYVKSTAANDVPDGSLKLVDPPVWLNQDWVNTLIDAANGKRFALNETSAKAITDRLGSLSWLDDVRVQVTPEYLTVEADYRRPVALIHTSRDHKVYLDSEMHVLDFIPVSEIPIVEITGLRSKDVPASGQQWLADDAKAAVEILNWLYRMDLHFQSQKQQQDGDNSAGVVSKTPEKPLLNEIESIDVSNFGSRKSRSAPNIVLHVKGGVKVYWGAAWGKAAVSMEAPEKSKLARLYQFFVDHDNTLCGTAKYIELRWLEDSIPRPQ